MKKNDQVTIRLPEELRNFEAFGFNSMTDFVKVALKEYAANHLSIVQKSAHILQEISELVELLENIRDEKSIGNLSENMENLTYTTEMEEHYEASYRAAKEIASTKLMLNSEINQIDKPGEILEPGDSKKLYKFTWALS